MTAWAYRNPVQLRFGAGVIDEIGTVVGGRSYLLVTHPDAPMRPWRDRVAALAGQPLAYIDDIEPNPSLAMLQGICGRLQEAKIQPEVVVALGGGSVIDSAKFIAAGHGRYEPAHAFLETGAAIETKALPVIAIPTTAGTGSDLTKWATIWDPQNGRKLSLNREDLYSEAVLADPAITISLPWSITLASGLDALSHALESIWNVNASPVTRTFAVAAARDIMMALPRLREDPDDMEARALMMLGASKAGLAFSNTQTALAHNISYPITLRHQVAHGIACSFCLPDVMVAACGVESACDEALEAIFGDLPSAPNRLRQFLDALGVPASHYVLSIADDEWNDIVAEAFAGPRGKNFIGPPVRFPKR